MQLNKVILCIGRSVAFEGLMQLKPFSCHLSFFFFTIFDVKSLTMLPMRFCSVSWMTKFFIRELKF